MDISPSAVDLILEAIPMGLDQSQPEAEPFLGAIPVGARAIPVPEVEPFLGATPKAKSRSTPADEGQVTSTLRREGQPSRSINDGIV